MVSKYLNKKTTIDGITFDSKKESVFYSELLLLMKAKIVVEITRQVPFLLQESFKKNGKTHRKIEYIADFVVEYADGHTEVIDVKSEFTKKDKVYCIKKKLFEYKYPNLSLLER